MQTLSPNSTIKKARKVYTLRKTNNVRSNAHSDNKTETNEKQIEQQKMQMSVQSNQNNSGMVQSLNRGQQSRVTAGGNNIQVSYISNKNHIQPLQPIYEPEVEGSDLRIDTLSIEFNTLLNNIQVKQVSVRNIGESAVYFQWNCKNLQKINSSAVKDPKSRFYCHYENNVIKPGQEITFAFSFLSDVPGIYIQQYDFICKPPLKTPIPSLKLEGKAYIIDQFQSARRRFLEDLKEGSLSTDVQQILQDVIGQVKPPQEPLPDVSKPQIAERQFERKNASLGLFYNPIVHGWFRQLFRDVWIKINGEISTHQVLQQPAQGEQKNERELSKKKLFEPFWDQSVQTLKQVIVSSPQQKVDEVDKICYLERLNHYFHLSTFPPSNKSQLFPSIKESIFASAFKLGGDFNDQTRKELQMWETAFRQPQQTDTQDDQKAYKQQIAKIKAQWLKKAKKKKWTEQDQKALLQDYRKKLIDRVNQDILRKFQGFEEKAEFIKAQGLLQNTSVDIRKYSDFLQRIKTVKQTPIQGKKILLKFNLKLKPNSQQKLLQLKQYIQLKKEQQKRQQQQKKNQQQNAKKKKVVPKKKKGGKQQQQTVSKPLFFNFMQLFDQQNWNGFVQTYKVIQQKSPMLTLIGCCFGGRQGRYVEQQSVRFLLDYLKSSLDPAIEFLQHKGLAQIQSKIIEETLNQGSVYLLENLNFLPYQVMQKQEQVKNQQPKHESQQKSITHQLRKLLYPQISSLVRQDLKSVVDVVVSQDRFGQPSGIMSYLFKQNIVGTLWWKYLSFAIRLFKNWRISGKNYFILGGSFDAEKLLILGRLLQNSSQQIKNQEKRCLAEKVQLVGQIGIKFALVNQWNKQGVQISNDGKQWFGFHISKNQSNVISRFLQKLRQANCLDRLILPCDVIIRQKQIQQEKMAEQANLKLLQTKCLTFGEQNIPSQDKFVISDIGNATISQISQMITLNAGHCSISGYPTLFQKQFYAKQNQASSQVSLIRILYKNQQQKKNRHQIEQMGHGGINYEKDMVILLSGIDQNMVESINLKEKKVKERKVNDQGEQEQEQQEQQEAENADEEGKKKIDLVSDFRVSSYKCVFRLLSGKFNLGIRDIERYPKSDE